MSRGLHPSLAKAQGNINQRAQNAANREMIDAGTKFAGDLATYSFNSSRLNDLKGSLGRSYSQYFDITQDPGASDVERALATEKMQGLDIVNSSTNITNLDEFGGLYDKVMGGTSKYSDIMSKQKIAQIKADAIKEVARAKRDSSIRLQREKLIHDDGLGDVGDDSFGSLSDIFAIDGYFGE